MQTSDENTASISKSERKRIATDLQKIGLQLAQLKPDQLATFDLPERLSKAILDYQRFPSREAKRRQLQYVGRVMRDTDSNVIAQQLTDLEGQSAATRYSHHQLEHWREVLIKSPQALTEFIDQFPHVDKQQLRHLVKYARQDQAEVASSAAARRLYRFLREAIDI